MDKGWKRFLLRNGVWVFALLIGLCSALYVQKDQKKENDIQKEIAEKVVRFRVLPNSGKREDQDLKIQVRDSLLAEIEPWIEYADGQLSICTILENHMDQLRKTAEDTVKNYGQSDTVELSLGWTWFPEKTYGNCTFPEGKYQALVVKIGHGRGENWWCMLYPALCFTDALQPIVDEEQEQTLKKILPEEAYREIKKENVRFSWKISSLLSWF